MKIWHYRPITHELLGPGLADPNPMEPGEWLIPANATTADPGGAQLGRAYRFAGSSWESVPDCRGEKWWPIDAEFNTAPVTIDFIGDPAERGLTSFEPPAPPVIVPPIVVSPDQIRRALNRMGLRTMVEKYVSTANQDARDIWQYAAAFQRDNAVIVAAAAANGTAPAEVDALFELAKSL